MRNCGAIWQFHVPDRRDAVRRKPGLPPPLLTRGFSQAQVSAILRAEVSLAEQHPLAAPLVLSDLQSGIVGQTGTVWTVAPDYGFTVARQIVVKTADPHRRGHLPPEQQGQLRELLARIDPAALPRQIGKPRVNGRQILLTYGQAASSLNLPAGGGSLGALRATVTDPNAGRFLELADLLQQMIGN
jgi:hypothetical protein